MNEIPVYVISLEKDIHRREQLSKQFKYFYPKMHIIDAIDGRKLDKEVVDTHVKHYQKKYHKQMSPGEVGCALSHVKTLEEFVNSGEKFALILEDDILGFDEDLKILNSLNISSLSDDMVMICWKQTTSARAKYVLGKEVFQNILDIPKPLYPNIIGACCYIVTQKSAKAILETQKNTLLLADQWGDLLQNNSTKMYFIDIFSHPEESLDSNLAHGRKDMTEKKKRRVFNSIIKEVERIYRRLVVQFYKLLGYKNINKK